MVVKKKISKVQKWTTNLGGFKLGVLKFTAVFEIPIILWGFGEYRKIIFGIVKGFLGFVEVIESIENESVI